MVFAVDLGLGFRTLLDHPSDYTATSAKISTFIAKVMILAGKIIALFGCCFFDS